jgi:prepilin-type N-terminal cleavage/methylation domain-containing protein
MAETRTRFVSQGRARQARILSDARGFTLLEVILALALSLIVIAAVGVSVHLYLRLFDSGRTDVEEAQLARAVLRRMADDIRGAVAHNAVDASQLVPQTSGTSSSSSSAGGANTSGGAGSSTTGGATTDVADSGNTADTGEMSESSDSATAAIDDSTDLSSTGPQTVPGLYGNSTQLQIDVSRLPRLDQYVLANQQNTVDTMAGADTAAMDHISDVKNVAYYVMGSTSSLGLGAGTGMQTGFGLVRRDMDRASALYASQSMEAGNLDSASEVVAPEIEAVQFAYFDGQNQIWLNSWDSSQYGGLPLAVQITIAITRPPRRGGEVPLPGVYSVLVNIPSASIAGSTASGTDASSAGSTTSQDSSATSQSNTDTSAAQAPSVSSDSTPSPSTPSNQQNNSGRTR